MMNARVYPVSAMLIAPPGQLCDGLQKLLQSVPQVTKVLRVYDIQSVLEIEQAYCPGLIVLDYDASQNEYLALLSQIRARCPKVRSIILVESEYDQEVCRHADADAVLVEGILATRLLAIIEALLTGADISGSVSSSV